MARNRLCPLCGAETDAVLQLHFNEKMRLPTEPEIRHCAGDNFLFVAGGDQGDYDETDHWRTIHITRNWQAKIFILLSPYFKNLTL